MSKVYCKHILFVLAFGLDVQSVLQAYTVCVGIRVRCPKCTASIYCLCWHSGQMSKVYCKHILFVLAFGLDVQSVLQAYTVCVGIRVRCPKCTASIYCLCWHSGQMSKVYCKHKLFVLAFGLDVQSVLQAYTVCVGIRVRCPKCTASINCLCWHSGQMSKVYCKHILFVLAFGLDVQSVLQAYTVCVGIRVRCPKCTASINCLCWHSGQMSKVYCKHILFVLAFGLDVQSVLQAYTVCVGIRVRCPKCTASIYCLCWHSGQMSKVYCKHILFVLAFGLDVQSVLQAYTVCVGIRVRCPKCTASINCLCWHSGQMSKVYCKHILFVLAFGLDVQSVLQA